MMIKMLQYDIVILIFCKNNSIDIFLKYVKKSDLI